MRHIPFAAALAMLPVMLAGCGSDSALPVAPEQPSLAAGAAANAQGGNRDEIRINMQDACDPASFNAIVGAGTCVRSGGMTFQNFIGQLTKHHVVGAWHFAPQAFSASVGQEVEAYNLGGEEHTFTHVAAFGGGLVASLNELSGNLVVAPECLDLDEDDVVAPGATYEEELEEAGTQYFQCCFHPWMRTVGHVH
jgi:plastocyanin